MKRIILLILGLASCAGSAFCAVRGYLYYSYLQGTGLLFAKTTSAAHIKYYPYYLIAAAVLGVIGFVLLILFNVMLAKKRAMKNDAANQAAANALFGK